MSTESTPDTSSPAASFLEGTVIRSTGSWYDVQAKGQVIPSKVRGKFRLQEHEVTNPIAVGDQVTIRLNPDDTGLITAIHERKNALRRRAAGRRVGREQVLVANTDVVWVIQAVRLPRPNPGFIDRILVTTESQDIEAGLIFNKTDLLREEDQPSLALLHRLYTDLGYEVLMVSAQTGEGVEAFRERLVGRTSVVTGPSGVGKSTLLNVIEPGLDLRTGEVSPKTRKGRHVTTHAALFPLTQGGFVVDTPGIREFGILFLEPWELSHQFRDFKPYLAHCRFPTCTHDHEPGCAVKEAVLDDTITEERYYSYLNILHSIHLGEKDVGR